MEDIKTEYCGGNQNFVVAVNDDHGLAVGRSSMPFDTARAEDAIASAVYDYAFKSNESNLILFHTSSRSFEKTRVETMATATTSTLQCANFDLWFLRGEDQPIPDTSGPYVWSAALSVGMPPNSTCEEPRLLHPALMFFLLSWRSCFDFVGHTLGFVVSILVTQSLFRYHTSGHDQPLCRCRRTAPAHGVRRDLRLR